MGNPALGVVDHPGRQGPGAVVEAPFTLLDKQVEVLAGDAVVAPQAALRLVPVKFWGHQILGT